jgi:repressor LexA
VFFEILSQLINQKGTSKNQILKDLHLAKGSISNWENRGTVPSGETLSKIANYFNVTTDYLLTGTSNIKPSNKSKGVSIPVLGYVRAGIPIEAIEDILDYEEITPELAAQGEFFALSIKGDSMEPKISEGDVAIVQVQPDIESGELAIVLVNGQDATIKKVLKSTHGITLIPFNSNYEPMVFTNEEIEQLPVSIVGKVVEVRQKW